MKKMRGKEQKIKRKDLEVLSVKKETLVLVLFNVFP